MPKTAAKKAAGKTMGRPPGSKNAQPRGKRQLTPIQKLREHILIELGVDKADIAKAIGVNRQTVSHVFNDIHRSEVEGQIVAYLQATYRKSDLETRSRVRGFLVDVIERDYVDETQVLTADTLGWSQRSAPPFKLADDEDERGEG
jgi:hypothetical protein